jgi:hypothetical protein
MRSSRTEEPDPLVADIQQFAADLQYELANRGVACITEEPRDLHGFSWFSRGGVRYGACLSEPPAACGHVARSIAPCDMGVQRDGLLTQAVSTACVGPVDQVMRETRLTLVRASGSLCNWCSSPTVSDATGAARLEARPRRVGRLRWYAVSPELRPEWVAGDRVRQGLGQP